MSERPIATIAHAVEAMEEWGIRPEPVECSLREPPLVRADQSRHPRQNAFRRIAEFGDRWLRVVYEENGDLLVVTAVFDRGMK